MTDDRSSVQKLLSVTLSAMVVFSVVTVLAPSALDIAGAANQSGQTTQIHDWNDLDAVRNDVTGDYVLANDLNESTTGYDTVAGPNANGGDGFEPIGKSYPDPAFGGSFDGDGHTIAGLHIDRRSADYVGLFGYVNESGTIRDVELQDINFTGYEYVGGLVAYNEDGTIANVTTSGDLVTEGGSAGGLVGRNELGTIENSTASVNISGAGTYAGGLVGYNDGGSVIDAAAHGDVDINNWHAGGLIGENIDSPVSDSIATGDVSANGALGGLIGGNDESPITNSSATGTVIGDVNSDGVVGGLIGENTDSTVRFSNATGDISGEDDVGGLIGYNRGSSNITASYATGDVSGITNAGGLVGRNSFDGASPDINNSYATGNVTGDTNVGGLVGKNVGDETDTVYDDLTPRINRSYAVGTVGGSTNVSGLVGYNFDGYVNHSYWDTETTNQAQPIKSNEGYTDGLVGLTTAEMKGDVAQTNMTALAFPRVFDVVDNSTHISYPFLTATTQVPAPGLEQVGQNPANFAVTLDATNSPVDEGETLTVDATIENTGDASGTQTVNLSVDGTERESTSLTLNSGESSSVTLSWATDDGDVGDYTAAVASDNSTDTASVSVEAPSTLTSTPTDSGSGGGGGSETPEPTATATPEPSAELSVVESVAFGSISTGTEANRTVILANDGNAPLQVSDLSVTGSDAFSLGDSSLAEGGTIEAGGEREVTLSFAPRLDGEYRGSLDIDHAGEGPNEVALTGTGVSSDLSVEPSSLPFGAVPVGENATAELAVTNDGDETTTFPLLSVSNASGITVQALEETTLQPGESRTLTVRFSPTASGPLHGTLIVGEGETALSVGLLGAGVEPDIVVEPTALGFEEAVVGEELTRTFEVRNDGVGPLRVSNLTLTGDDADVFSVDDSNATLEPKTSREFAVTFAPNETGDYSATLQVVSNDPDEPLVDVWLSNTETVVRREATTANETTQVNVSVENPVPGEPVEIAMSTEGSDDDDVALDSLTVESESDESFTLSVSSSEQPTVTTQSFNLSDGTLGLGYLNVDHSIPDEDIGSVEFEFRVSKAKLQQTGTDPDEVVLHRYSEDQWSKLPTTIEQETESHYILRGESPGLSNFVVGGEQAKFELLQALVDVARLTVGDEMAVRVRITNVGGADGTFTAQLLLNEQVVQERDITIAANGTRQAAFERELGDAGQYAVRVNDERAGNVSVQVPANATDGPVTATLSADGSGNETAETTDSDGGTGTTGFSFPGFGVGITLLSLFGAALLLRRQS